MISTSLKSSSSLLSNLKCNRCTPIEDTQTPVTVPKKTITPKNLSTLSPMKFGGLLLSSLWRRLFTGKEAEVATSLLKRDGCFLILFSPGLMGYFQCLLSAQKANTVFDLSDLEGVVDRHISSTSAMVKEMSNASLLSLSTSFFYLRCFLCSDLLATSLVVALIRCFDMVTIEVITCYMNDHNNNNYCLLQLKGDYFVCREGQIFNGRLMLKFSLLKKNAHK